MYIVLTVFRLVFERVMLAKAKARLKRNDEFVNAYEYENRLLDAASMLRFLFYAYDKNIEKLNIEHNKDKSANIGFEFKSIARYIYSDINQEEPYEKPSKIIHPIVDEIISRYQAADLE